LPVTSAAGWAVAWAVVWVAEWAGAWPARAGWVVTAHKADAEQIKVTVRHRLSGYKVPKEVVFVDRVVRNPVGKADYEWAKETATEALRDSVREETAL